MSPTTKLRNNMRLTDLPAWKSLESHYLQIHSLHLRQMFADDLKRGERLTLGAAGLYLDYSKNRITDETIRLLVQLAEQAGLRDRIDAMFNGEEINITEDRAVLHIALRAPAKASITVDDHNVVPDVHAVLDKMSDFCNGVRDGEWRGHTGKRIRNIVNIGIGGSDLGPVMAYEALKYYSDRDLTFRFVSNIDSTDFAEAVGDLDPAETLFIVSSKTFTTLETMTNAQTARRWVLAGLGTTNSPSQSISSQSRQMLKKFRNSASIPRICLVSGTGLVAAILWIRLSAYRRCCDRTSTLSRPVEGLPRD